jgi:hypothetical protein
MMVRCPGCYLKQDMPAPIPEHVILCPRCFDEMVVINPTEVLHSGTAKVSVRGSGVLFGGIMGCVFMDGALFLGACVVMTGFWPLIFPSIMSGCVSIIIGISVINRIWKDWRLRIDRPAGPGTVAALVTAILGLAISTSYLLGGCILYLYLDRILSGSHH